MAYQKGPNKKGHPKKAFLGCHFWDALFGGPR